jgi:hypothetical protein
VVWNMLAETSATSKTERRQAAPKESELLQYLLPATERTVLGLVASLAWAQLLETQGTVPVPSSGSSEDHQL